MTNDSQERLVAAGMSPIEAHGKSELFAKAAHALEGMTGHSSSLLWRCYVPGRIEVLGKHTDYAGGRSLLCAAERGFCFAASPRSDRVIRMTDTTDGLAAQIELSADATEQAGGWVVYPRTVARRVARNFSVELRGVDLAFASDLPRSAGLSSSSAFVVGVFAALDAANHLDQLGEFRENIRGPHDLASYLGCVENGQTFGTLAGDRGVGTFGGSEDHTAMLCCRAGHMSQFRFCPVSEERVVALPRETTFVIAVSGVDATKTETAREQYNRASLSAHTILRLWRDATWRSDSTLMSAATHAAGAAEQMREVLLRSSTTEFSAKELVGRFEQFFCETQQIIPGAVEAIASGNLATFGELVERSQRLAEQHLGNQIPETIELARSARTLGAVAASAFGAGFGGSVWALVGLEQAEEFRAAWEKYYRARFPVHATKSEFFISGAGPGLLQF